jgi:cyclophilin family peptidyl-prolyl cis-trans isomerase
MLRTALAPTAAVLLALALSACDSDAPAGAPSVQAGDQTRPPATAAETPAPPPGAEGSTVEEMRQFIASQPIDKTASGWKTKLPRPPQLEFDAARTYVWMLETSEGPIRIRLMPGHAPMHVSSTIYLSELGFYDGLTFHRVIPGFMAQGGDPLGTGTGSPGYRYDGEISPAVSHSKPGILSTANAGPGTDGSQFFLTFVPTPGLDPKHTIFGEVVEGMETVKALEKHGSASGKTTKPLVIESARIVVE